MHDVFISYSSREYPEAETVRMMLEENGISCWMAPGCIPGGSNYTKEIPVAIRECRVFVLILSDKAQSSHWVLKELDAAVGHGKVILPFMLRNFVLNDEFSFLLSGTQWYSAYLDADKALEEMVERIKSITSAPRPRERVHASKTPPQKPRVLPKIEAAPKAEPAPEPKADPEFRCPACSGADLAPLKNGRKSYDFGEAAHFLIVPVPAILIPAAVFLLGALVCMLTGYTTHTIGLTIGLILSIIALPFGILLGICLAKEQIRRKRIRRHMRACGVLCRTCSKKFRVVTTIEKAFPWETAEPN